MTTSTQNHLVSNHLVQALKDYPLYSQDGKKDATCIAILSIGNVKWYIFEGQPEGSDFTFFGIVVGLAATEYGYFSANEMAAVTIDASRYGLGELRVQEKIGFEPCPLSEIEDEELQAFLSNIYEK